jgi:MFS family permease
VADAASKSSQGRPPLAPALAAMTALQGVVALGLFAPGVLAPALGLGTADIALYSTGCFAVGMAGALWGGGLVGRFGSFAVAAFCAAATAAAMGLAAVGSPAALLAAGLALGLAFGPETPASSALLGKLARPEQRPLIFSVRQTGNQIGAIIGSLTLPWLVLLHPQAGYGAVAMTAGVGVLIFLALRGRYDPVTLDASASSSPRAAWALLGRDPAVRRLAMVSVPLSAMQLGLNAYLVTYLTGALGLTHVAAGTALGVAQAGGLVGRLTWGAVAGRVGASVPVIAGLGLGMAAAGIAMAMLPAATPWPLLVALAFVFGLTASGWNGVFLSEVARIAPDGRVAEATGAVLTASYGGLLAGPTVITLLATAGGLRLSYAVLGAACLLAALWLMKRP